MIIETRMRGFTGVTKSSLVDRPCFLSGLPGLVACDRLLTSSLQSSFSDGRIAGAGAASAPVDVEMEELCNDFAAVLESERAAGHTLSFLVSIHCHGVSEGQGY